MFPVHIFLILALAFAVSSHPLQAFGDQPPRCVYTTDSTKLKMDIHSCPKSCGDLAPKAILLEGFTLKYIYLYCAVPSSNILVGEANVHQPAIVV